MLCGALTPSFALSLAANLVSTRIRNERPSRPWFPGWSVAFVFPSAGSSLSARAMRPPWCVGVMLNWILTGFAFVVVLGSVAWRTIKRAGGQ